MTSLIEPGHLVPHRVHVTWSRAAACYKEDRWMRSCCKGSEWRDGDNACWHETASPRRGLSKPARGLQLLKREMERIA